MRLRNTVAICCLALGALAPIEAQIRIPRGGKATQGNVNQKQSKQDKQAKQAELLERFLQMSPEQRRTALEQLPPARRRQFFQRLQTLELLSGDERRMLHGRFQAFSGLPGVRQKAVRAELQNLRGMTPAERRRRMASDEIRNTFSEEERQLLYQVGGRPPAQE
ncbi:MAG: DUF3106 domain-containing protein [Acidobacteriota bacterium]